MSDSGLTTVFLTARRLTGKERRHYLAVACRDLKVRDTVARMLRDDLEAEGLLPVDDPARVLDSLIHQALEPEASHPAQLGPFPITGLLGRGGMGVVYRSWQEEPRRPIALKVLRADLVDSDWLRRFEREVEILSRLDHPGIVRVYGAGSVATDLGRLPYIAMELVEGTPLLEYARTLSVRERVELLLKLCGAVEHAHSAGVLHRDLKPGNVLVQGDGTVRVLDFGVALMLGGNTTLTQSGQLVGTLPYMSPEQLDGSTELDARADVYALGVCAFQLVTGRLPHDLEGCSLGEALRQLASSESPLAGDFEREARGALEAIVHRAMAADRRTRYSTVRELVAELRGYLAGERVRARVPGRVARAWVRWRRFTPAVLLLAALIGALAHLAARARQSEFETELVSYVRTREALAKMRTRAAELWPHRSFTEPDFEAWLSAAEELRTQLRPLRQRQAELAREESDSEALRELQEVLASLVPEMEHFSADDARAGLVAGVRERLERGTQQGRRLASGHVEEWDACRRAISASSTYGGLVLEVQRGLVPLRADPRSGLWEFVSVRARF